MNERERQVAERLINYYIHILEQAQIKYNDPAVIRVYAAGRLIRMIARLAADDSLVRTSVLDAIRRDQDG